MLTQIVKGLVGGRPFGVVLVTEFGAKGDGVVDDTSAIQGAIDACANGRGGIVMFPPGVYGISSPIRLKPGVHLVGSGAGDYSDASKRPSVIAPLASFAGSAAIIADPATYGTGLLIAGISVGWLTIDMNAVASSGISGLECRSVSNPEPFVALRILNQDAGSYIVLGKSANAGALPCEGITFIDVFCLSKSIDPANTVPGVIIEESNEVTFLSGKIMRRSNGSPTAGSVGVAIRSNGSGVNAVTFDATAIAGYEKHVRVSNLSGAQSPRWIRFMNMTFETYNIGVEITGTSATPSQFCVVGPGNRFLTPVGVTPKKIVLDYAANCTVFDDEFTPPGGYSVYLTPNSQSNIVMALPGSEYNAGQNNLIFGREYDNLALRTGEIRHSARGRGPVVTTPDGTKRYRIRVDNAGTIVTELVL